MLDPLIELLANNRVFHGLTEQELSEVRAAGNIRRYAAGSLLIRQGDPALAFQLIVCGHAKMTQVTPSGQQILIRYVQPGFGFGLTSALQEFDYLWSVQAIGACRALVWHGEALAQLMERYSRIAFNALRVMVMRNQQDQRRYLELLTEPVEQRVAQALLRLTVDVGRKTGEGILIDVPLSREDLAEYSGTTVYSVSRILRQWTSAGVVRTGRERVIVRSTDRLWEIAESAG